VALLLTEDDVRELLDPVALIAAMERALAGFSSGESVQPVRSVIGLNENSFFGVMPALMPALPVHGAKFLTVLPGNRERGIPTHRATIMLADPCTGDLLAILDGRLITEMRTAAVSAISVRYLARWDSKVLAILGNGVQARSHREVFPLVHRFDEIRGWSPTTRSGHAASAQEAVEGADVIVLATSSTVPVIEDAWVKPGAHVISIGACVPTQREIDPALVARSHLVVDSRAAALKESGDVVQGIREGRFTEEHVKAELGELILHNRVRTSEDDVTVFKSLGLAVEDIAAAHLVYLRARETGKGREIEI